MDMQNNFVTPVEKVELPLSNDAGELMILTEKIAGVIARSGIPKTKIAGVGIGMPGFVDVQKGVNYSFLKLADKSIVDHISGVVGLPVFIDNDSSLIALAELRFGAARQKKNAMVVNIGWGIGLGMILNGQLFRGHNGFAGELSHIPLFSNGKLCSCGKSGCLETESSLLLVIEKVKEGLSSGRASRMKLSAMAHYEEGSEALVQAAREGDRFAIELFSQTAYNIGRGVAVLIHLLNPETIILSGRGSSAGKVWQAPIQQAVNEHCIPRLAMNTSIEMSTLGYDAELIGAAALVMENYEKGAAEDIASTAVEEDFLLEN
jgi:glucokinase-like ROK family protein